MKHFKTYIIEKAEKIVLYSDACGGQNRNIKMTLQLKHFLASNNHNIQEIEQNFFISGHSYNSCDRSFGLIEKEKRKTPEIYCPNDWVEVIRGAKKTKPNFNVIVMTSGDFYSTKTLENAITNRKRDIAGSKFSWFDIRKISNHKNQPFILNIETNDKTNFNINIKKNRNNDEVELENIWQLLLNDSDRAISNEKYNDLISLLPYIPENHHEFYKSLKHHNINGDDLVSGSSDSE